jgi:hypothetical protein
MIIKIATLPTGLEKNFLEKSRPQTGCHTCEVARKSEKGVMLQYDTSLPGGRQGPLQRET